MYARQRYHISVEFHAPLSFAYAWCTDYTPDDGTYGGEDRTVGLQRRIIEKDSRRVIFENLYDEGKGWAWEHHVVTLFPPNRWHCVGRGNFQESVLDYSLTTLTDGRTRFDMRWKSRPIGLSKGPRARVSQIEAYVTALWRKRARFLESDYRRSLKRLKSHR